MNRPGRGLSLRSTAARIGLTRANALRLQPRLRKRTLALLALLGFMVVATAFWATLRQTALLKETLESQLSESFGATVTIDKVDWNGWGTIVAEGLTLRVADWPAPANQVAAIDRAVVTFDPTGLLAGRLSLDDMEIDGLTLRIVEDAASPGRMNLLALKPKAGRSGGVSQPKKALMRNLRIELALQRGADMEMVARREFTGAFEHVPDDPSLYSFELSQIATGDEALSAPIRLFGTWDERTFAYEVTLDSLPISPETLALLPLRQRLWATQTKLSGRIESARLSGSPSSLVSFSELDVRDVTFRERDAVRAVPWARMEGDRITPIRGDVTVQLPRATLVSRGSRVEVTASDARIQPGAPGSGAVDIPIELKFTTDLGTLPGLNFKFDATEAWLSETISTAPFDLAVRMAGVSALPGRDGLVRPVELPLPLVDVLREFGVRDWLADIDLSVSRAPATIGPDGSPIPGKVIPKGRLALADGTIRYEGFAYRLDHVTGAIEFDGSSATIRELAGQGSGDALVRISGTVQVEEANPAFSVRIVGTDVPIDERLVQGMDPVTQEILDQLLDRHAFESLRAANLSDDTWAPGGLVGFDLTVHQTAERGASTVVEGTIDVQQANVVLDSFPYPMRVKGSVILRDESVTLTGNGFTATTPSGSSGVIRGRILTPRAPEGRRVDTDIAFDFQNERVTPLLLAAIPVSFMGDAPQPDGWPGTVRAPVSQLMSALGVDGNLDITGSVRTADNGSEEVRAQLSVRAGTLTPTDELAGVLRRFGLSWPSRLALTDVSGKLTLSPGLLTIEQMSARRGEGAATAQGQFSADGQSGSLLIQVSDFPLSRDFIGVAETDEKSPAYRTWDALQPQGAFDATLSWARTGETVTTAAHGSLDWLTLAGGSAFTHQCGEFAYRDGEVVVTDLEMHSVGPTGERIVIAANGTITGAAPAFTATATGMTLATPVVDSGLRAADLDEIADTLRDWHMDGGFSMRLAVGKVPAEGEAWSLHVEPTWLTGDAARDPFSLRFSQGEIVAAPSGVRFEGLVARLMHGEVSLTGSIRPDGDGGQSGDLLLGVDLSQWSPDLEALLPDNAQGALRSIEFDATAAVTADAFRIQFQLPREGASQVDVDGDLDIARGTFRAGTGFREADGTLGFRLSTVGGRPSGHIALDFGRLHVVDREATDVRARLVFNAQSDSVTLEGLEGWMYGGRVVGSAHAQFGGAYQASVTFANVQFAPFAEANDTPQQRAEAARERGPNAPMGRMRGKFELSGMFGEPELQRGTGRVAVQDARMVEFPLGMSILQITQLMLPLNAALDRADAEFEVIGDIVTFEKFVLASSTLRLEGSGRLSLGDGDLALRFRNRGTLPVVSDIFGAVVGDQVFMIDVGGTLQDPRPHLVPIPILSPEPSLPALSADTRRPQP
jgi:hypothetical protein